MRILLVNAALVLGLGLASAGRAENRVVLNIEPTPEHPRNSEGSFATLGSGRVIFAYTQFTGGAQDNSAARIALVESGDGGRSWGEARVLVENAGAENVMSVSLLRLRGGRLLLLYLLKNSWIDCRPRVCLSSDDGRTWSEPRRVIDAPGYFVVNNDRVVQLASGRLIVPASFHRARGEDPRSAKSFDGRGIAMWFLSDDEGSTWREARTWWAAPRACSTGLQEPGAVELADGRVFSWARTGLGAQYGFLSADGGETWSAPEATEMLSPASPASVKRLPGSGDLLALYNDHGGRFDFVPGRRTPLVAAISSDGGKTWPRRKLLEGDPEGWYCYAAIHFVGDAALLGYCAGDKKVGGLNRLRIRRVSLDWLRAD